MCLSLPATFILVQYLWARSNWSTPWDSALKFRLLALHTYIRLGIQWQAVIKRNSIYRSKKFYRQDPVGITWHHCVASITRKRLNIFSASKKLDSEQIVLKSSTGIVGGKNESFFSPRQSQSSSSTQFAPSLIFSRLKKCLIFREWISKILFFFLGILFFLQKLFEGIGNPKCWNSSPPPPPLAFSSA